MLYVRKLSTVIFEKIKKILEPIETITLNTIKILFRLKQNAKFVTKLQQNDVLYKLF